MVSRRQFLRSLGAGAALSPFIPQLEAFAQANAPRRMVYCFQHLHSAYGSWLPSGSGPNFNLGSSLAPLEPLKDRVVQIAGLDISNWQNMTSGNEHTHALVAHLTGRLEAPNGHASTGISVDQHIANSLALQGVSTRFKSLYFLVDTHDTTWPIVFRSAGQPVQAPREPAERISRPLWFRSRWILGRAGAKSHLAQEEYPRHPARRSESFSPQTFIDRQTSDGWAPRRPARN